MKQTNKKLHNPKGKFDKLESIKIQNCCSFKRQHEENGEKYQENTFYKVSICIIYKQFLQIREKGPNNLVVKWTKT